MATKTLPEWEDQAFSKVLSASFRKSENPSIYFLERLVEELKEENVPEPYLIDSTMLDRALMSILSDESSRVSAAQFLTECWEKAMVIRSNLATRGASTLSPDVLKARLESLDVAQKLFISYLGLSIIYPDMFCSGPGSTEWFFGRLLEGEISILTTLLDELMQRFIGDGFEQVISLLLNKKEAVVALTQAPNWEPEADTPPPALEDSLLLGPLLLLSTFPDAKNPVHGDFFIDSSGESSKVDISSTFSTLRSTNQNITSSQFGILDKIVRSGAETRDAFLRVVSRVVKANTKRTGLQVDKATVSSDRFLLTLNQLLLRFALPFMDVGHSKVARIEADYFRASKLLNFQDEARLGATLEDFRGYVQTGEERGVGFISDVFHLLVATSHLGAIQVMQEHSRSGRDLHEQERQMQRFEAGRDSWSGPMAPFNESMLKRLKANLVTAKALSQAREAFLMDPQFLDGFNRLYALMMVFLLRQLDPSHSYPSKPLELPLLAEGELPPCVLIMLPEFYLDDPIEYYSFIARWRLEEVVQLPLDELTTFTTAFLTHGSAINNPHLKLKLVELLGLLVQPTRTHPEGVIGATLVSHPVALKSLLRALLRYYVEVEHTGLSSQFHDKFNARFNICRLLRVMWPNPTHQTQMSLLSQDMDFFVRLVNLLMNDTTYLLDESLSKLTEISAIQIEMEDPGWGARPAEQRQEREALLSSDDRQTKMYVALSNENVHLLLLMTQSLPAPFLSSEIVTRLAAMLNYTLTALVGPRCSQLKVKRPERYQFNPRSLLTKILGIYLNLNTPVFARALAQDGRSYNTGLYRRAAGILSKHNLVEQTRLDEFADLANQAETFYNEESQADADLGDIPEEFLDPLMFTLMSEPVTLPSGVTIDLATIKAHLLSDSTDPFNRQPLQLSQCQPNLELKARIMEFLNQARAKS